MKKVFIAAALIFLGICPAGFGQHTENRADQTLRSTGRVNPSTLALEIEIPLGSYPGRGVSLPISLSYTSKVWRLQNNGLNQHIWINNQTCYSVLNPKYSETSAAGWSSSLGFVYVDYTGETNLYNELGQAYSQGNPPCSSGNSSNSNRGYIKRVEVHLPNGETHELRASDTPIIYNRDTATAEMTGTYYAVDGSNLKYTDDGSGTCRLSLPNGAYYDFAAKTWLREAHIRKATRYGDPNGNQIIYGENSTYPNGYWTDMTLGRTIPVPLSPTTAPLSATVQDYQLPGMSNPYHFVWQQLKGASAAESGLTDFNQALKYAGVHSVAPSVAQPNTAHPEGALFHDSTNTMTFTGNDPLFNPIVLTEIQLPDGSKYKFSYNIYGEIEKIVYPTGGEERFTLNPVAAIDGISQETPYLEANRGVTQRQIYENAAATPQTWTYTNGGSAFVTLTAPDGTRTERMLNTFSSCDNCGDDGDGDWGFNFVLAGMPAEERSYSAPTSAAPNGQLLSKKLTTWTKTEFNVPTSPLKNPEWFPRVTKEENIIDDPATGSGISTTTALEYEGDLTQRDTPLLTKTSSQYGFVAAGAALPATPVRTSETTYLQNDPRYAAVRGDYLAQNMVGLATVAVVKDGAGTVSRSEMKYDAVDSPSARGNLTDVRVWDSTKNSDSTDPAAYIATHARFDTHGNRVEARDAKGKTTTTVYDTTYEAFPVSVTTPPPGDGVTGALTPFTTGATFDPVTGLPLTTTDVNGQITQIFYEDPFLRPTKVIAPNGQQTITEYGVGTSAATRFVKSRTQLDATNWKEGFAWYDGLGRTYKTQSVTAGGDVFTETEFDTAGRAYRVTNPYRTGETKVWTTTNYDAAGRAFEVVTADGAKVTTAYGVATGGANIGTVVTVTDQALKQRRSITNALGQLTRVDEPDDTGNLGDVASPNQATFYSYDTLNNLTTVTQGGQTRSFAYNSLSQLKTATNPESGLISYSYDPNGNLSSKTDARSITTAYTYDNLNRVVLRDYSDTTPDVSYFYDNLTNAKGKLTKVVTAATATNAVTETRYLAFDILGRVTSSQQVTDNVTYNPQTYVYNLSGALLEETYPSGRVVKNTLDNDGDLAQVQSAKAGGTLQNYANSFTYTAAGAVSSMKLGNGKWENTQFNSRLQPVQIGLGSSATSQNLLKLNYEYGTTDNNGNVKSQQINFQGLAQPFIQTYTYDSLNRLKSAFENQNGAQNWKQTFVFDRFGNRTFDTNNGNTTTLAAGCQTNVCNPAANPANNRLNGTTYDDAGNTTTDGGGAASGNSFVYDAENKQVQVSNSSGIVGQYFYDGDGKRVKKIVYTNNVPSETTIFVYDAGGKMVAEYSTVTATTPQVSYLTNDTLGSPRITTDANGAVISRRDFMPFGEEVTTGRTGYGADAVRQKFTAYERDNETALDFAQARMFGSSVGRFTSPDPTLLSVKSTFPQTWNRYVYVTNNPLRYVDPFGLWALVRGYYADKDGNRVRGYAFVKTKDKDDAASLVKQLGFDPKDKGVGQALLASITTGLGENKVIGLSKIDSGGKVGNFLSTVEKKLVSQDVFDETHKDGKGNKTNDGPDDKESFDCSSTTCRLSFPKEMAKKSEVNEGNFGVSTADEMISELTTPIKSENDLRTGDILRYGKGENRHFGNFVFKDDNGVPQVFSRLGKGNAFTTHSIRDTTVTGFNNRGGVNGMFRPK